MKRRIAWLLMSCLVGLSLVLASCTQPAPTTPTTPAVPIPPTTPATPTPPTAPAVFAISDLTITPTEVDIGERVTISVLVANSGDLAGSYEVTLKIDEVEVATEWVTLDGGASRNVTFTAAKDIAGTYVVDVDGLSGIFVVKATLAPGMEHFSGQGISFDYPEEWHEVGFSWEPGYEWGICFSGGTGDEPGVFVLKYALGDKTLEQFTLESEDIGYGSDFTISTPVETTVGGQPAYRYTYSGTKYGVAVQGDTVLVQDGESVWWIDCFATEAEYAQNKSNFEMVIESFVIE